MNRRERWARRFWSLLTRVLFCSWQGHDDRGFYAGLQCSRCGRMTPGIQIDDVRAAQLARSRAALDEWQRWKHPEIIISVKIHNEAGRQMADVLRQFKSKQGAA